jgi:hypothetical protein
MGGHGIGRRGGRVGIDRAGRMRGLSQPGSILFPESAAGVYALAEAVNSWLRWKEAGRMLGAAEARRPKFETG